MLNLKKLSVLALALVISVAMMSCSKEGPTGPSGSATCGICHSAKADDVNLKMQQYKYSWHASGTLFEEEGGRVACGGCHTGQGYAEAADAGVNDPVAHAEGPISCRTCHPIHTDYALTDFTLRQKTGFITRIGGNEVDLKRGNTCARCHQGRAFTVPTTDTILKSTGTTTNSGFGPHNGPITNIFTMNGPFPVAGSVPVPTSNIHGTLSKGCVSCHMGTIQSRSSAVPPVITPNPATGGHTFNVLAAQYVGITSTECTAACHQDPATQFKTAAVAVQVKKDLATYKAKLLEKGMLDTSRVRDTDGSYNIFGERLAATTAGKVYTPADMQVALNYIYIVRDKSNGAHNPTYIKALLTNGIEYLSK